MASFSSFLLVYLLGGVSFIPLVVLLVLLHAYLVLPPAKELSPTPLDQDLFAGTATDGGITTPEQDPLPKSERARPQEADVAAGYFAVSRDYTAGASGKPPERITPAGETIASESPSVYQSMYRSIFDRNKVPTLDAGRGAKKARNVSFVVLRHGHLMLYDDSEQVEVRHVISLAHHEVSIYGGGGHIPEGELFIKRNAICLKRRVDIGQFGVNEVVPKPFYLFSDNCSEKEDFYIAMLQTQERRKYATESGACPLHFDVQDIVKLVQRLHSSEEDLQTRWINALVGRLFLALYKTKEVKDLVRKKITKKIARVKRPAFLSDITIQRIDMGHGPPHITNPRLKDLNVDGDCCVEADIHYAGGFRIQIATTARLELGSRFKAREVDLVLAVVLRKLDGHLLARCKPQPSNRIWLAFETMPKLDMSIEPIVSSRQITYGVVLRAIESRIREVIAETLVLPNWDDIPFYDTSQQKVRGGIWAHARAHASTTPAAEDPVTAAAEQGKVEEVRQKENEASNDVPKQLPMSKKDKSMSMPTLPAMSPSLTPRKTDKHSIQSQAPLQESDSIAVTSGAEIRQPPEKPKVMRSPSFASASSPIVSMDTATVDAIREQTRKEAKDATNAMIAISNRSQAASPTMSPVGSPAKYETSVVDRYGSYSSTSSKEEAFLETAMSSQPSFEVTDHESLPSTPRSANVDTTKSAQGPISNAKRAASIASKNFTTTAAKKWGWGVLNRNSDNASLKDNGGELDREARSLRSTGGASPHVASDRSSMTPAVPVPKRKPLPPPVLPPRRVAVPTEQGKAPPLPARKYENSDLSRQDDDEVLVVPAPPAESEPTSPMNEDWPENEPFPHIEAADDGLAASSESSGGHSEERYMMAASNVQGPAATARLSMSPEEHGGVLPGWMAAQEEEARAKSIWTDASNEHL